MSDAAAEAGREAVADADAASTGRQPTDDDADGAGRPGRVLGSEAEITRRPSTTGTAVAVVAAAVASLASLGGGVTPMLVSFSGTVLLGTALTYDRRRLVDPASLLVLAGVLLAGLAGLPAPALLLGTVASVVAWDVGTNAVVVGEQLGRETDADRPQLLHALGSTVAGVVAATLGLVLFQFGPQNQPAATVAVMLVAALLLVGALGR